VSPSRLSDGLRELLQPDTAQAWEVLAPELPAELYLVGGTGVAAHLEHRRSRDLDFFYHRSAVDLDALARRLGRLGRFEVTERAAGTLGGVLGATPVQVLHADEVRPQRRLEPSVPIAGMRVAGIADLMATKLAAVTGRGELRDYYDLMAIEQRTGRRVEEGLGLFLTRYEPTEPAGQAIGRIVTALGYLDDLDDDDLVPAARQDIAHYWQRRQPALLAATSRYGVAPARAGRPAR